jgi:hypothetical protein
VCGWREASGAVGARLPQPPTEEEKYSYLGPQRRWPFLWLFFSQACLIYAFVRVMMHSLETALALRCSPSWFRRRW